MKDLEVPVVVVFSSVLQFSLGLGFMCSHGNIASTVPSSSWSLGF